MAVRAGAVIIDFVANTSKFSLNMKHAERAVSSASARINRALAGIHNAARRVGASMATAARRTLNWKTGIATLVGTAGIGLLIRRSLDAADVIGKVADKVGLTTDQLQALRFAGEQTGVAVNTTDMALQRFSRRIGEVAQGQGALLKTAAQYNVAVRDQAGNMRPNIDILRDFADVIKNAESRQEQLRIAFKLFDSEGAAFVNLMRQGAGGIDDFTRQAREMGLIVREDLIRSAEGAKDKLNLLARVISAQLLTAVLKVAPVVERLAAALAKAIPLVANFLLNVSKRLGLIDPTPLERMRGEVTALNKEWQNTIQQGASAALEGDTKRAAVLAGRANALREQITTLQLSIQEMERLSTRIPRAGRVAASGRGGAVTIPQSGPTQAMKDSTKAVRENIAAMEKLKATGTAVFEATRTPLEKYNAEVERLNGLVVAGAINQDTYTRALKGAQKEFDEAAGTVKDLRDGFAEMGSTATSAMERIAFEGGKAKDVVRALLSDLTRILFRRTVTGPLSSALNNVLSSGFGGSSDTAAATAGPGGGFVAPAGMQEFSQGGSFTVPGARGPDRPHVLGLTGEETVTVTPAGRAGGGNTFVANMTFNNVNGRDEITRVVNEAMGAWQSIIVDKSVETVRDGQSRDRNFIRS